MKPSFLAAASRGAIAACLRASERAARPRKGSVLHADGTPVLNCDVRILTPYKLTPVGDYFRLTIA
jgi:hypothetical protein